MLQAGYSAGADEFREHGYEDPLGPAGRGEESAVERFLFRREFKTFGRGRSKQRPYGAESPIRRLAFPGGALILSGDGGAADFENFGEEEKVGEEGAEMDGGVEIVD